MRYCLLLSGHDRATAPWDELSAEQQGAEMNKHWAFSTACAEREGVEMVGGEQLNDPSTATSMKLVDGAITITDGPYAEATEAIGGFYVLTAPDLDTVIELVKILPAYDIEIRPIIEQG